MGLEMKKLIVKCIPKSKELIVPNKKQLTRSEQLLLEGKKYYNFILPIKVMNDWIALNNKTPNERVLELIKNDLEGTYEKEITKPNQPN
jgi:hypothetical protein